MSMYQGCTTPDEQVGPRWARSVRTFPPGSGRPLVGMGVAANDRAGEAEVVLDIDGLAARLGVTPRFVRRLVEGRVPYLKIGRLVRSTRPTWNLDRCRAARASAA